MYAKKCPVEATNEEQEENESVRLLHLCQSSNKYFFFTESHQDAEEYDEEVRTGT